MPLTATDLVFSYAGAPAPAINRLSLELRPGRVLALCGAARSGRSTALALLAGLVAPQQGMVTIDGVQGTSHDARGRAGLLLQNADEGLFGLTVREDVMFAPRQLKLSPVDASARVDEALSAVHLDPAHFGGRSPFSLSGGQRRRAAMAGVMAMKPAYLLLDEPFAGLDPQGRHEMIEVIRGIATRRFGEHTGILVALSEVDLALSLADSLVILFEGRSAWHGSVVEYMADPPDVSQSGLYQPDLVRLSACLTRSGWSLQATEPGPRALAAAIAACARKRDR